MTAEPKIKYKCGCTGKLVPGPNGLRYPSRCPEHDEPVILKRKNKNNAVTCKCISGKHIHRSQLEAKHCNILFSDLQDGRIKDYEYEKGFDLYCEGEKIARHYPDFLVTALDGTEYIVESKGQESEAWKMKSKLFQVNYPDIKYLVWKK